MKKLAANAANIMAGRGIDAARKGNAPGQGRGPLPTLMTKEVKNRLSNLKKELNKKNKDWPCTELYVEVLLETAKVLLKEGNTGSFFGLCLVADAEKREISISDPQYKY